MQQANEKPRIQGGVNVSTTTTLSSTGNDNTNRAYFEDFSLEWSEADEERWCISGIIPSESVGMLHGASGTGKTFLALDMACCVAAGVPFHGLPVEQGDVIYMAGEGMKGRKKRVRAWCDNHTDVDSKIIEERLHFLSSEYTYSMIIRSAIGTFPDFVSYIEEQSMNPVFLIIDTVSTFNADDENSETTAKEFIKGCNMASRKLGCAVLYIHHDGKPSERNGYSTTYRGSSAFYANADFSLSLKKKDKDSTLLGIDKMKDEESDKCWKVVYSSVVLDGAMRSDQKPVTSLYISSFEEAEDVEENKNVAKDFDDLRSFAISFCRCEGDQVWFNFDMFKPWYKTGHPDCKEDSIKRAYRSSSKGMNIDRWLNDGFIEKIGGRGLGTEYQIVHAEIASEVLSDDLHASL